MKLASIKPPNPAFEAFFVGQIMPSHHEHAVSESKTKG